MRTIFSGGGSSGAAYQRKSTDAPTSYCDAALFDVFKDTTHDASRVKHASKTISQTTRQFSFVTMSGALLSLQSLISIDDNVENLLCAEVWWKS